MTDTEHDEQHRPLKPHQVVASVLAAAFGVQSSRNRERDFKEGRFGTFIVAGILFTAPICRDGLLGRIDRPGECALTLIRWESRSTKKLRHQQPRQ